MGSSSRNGGVYGWKEIYGSLRCENFTNVSQSVDGKYAVKLSKPDLIKISMK